MTAFQAGRVVLSANGFGNSLELVNPKHRQQLRDRTGCHSVGIKRTPDAQFRSHQQHRAHY